MMKLWWLHVVADSDYWWGFAERCSFFCSPAPLSPLALSRFAFPRLCPRSRSLFVSPAPLSPFALSLPSATAPFRICGEGASVVAACPPFIPYPSAVLLLLCCLTRILGDLFNLARSCALLLLCLRSRSLVLRFRAVVPVRVLCLSPPRPCPRSRSLFHLLPPLSAFVEKVPLLFTPVAYWYPVWPKTRRRGVCAQYRNTVCTHGTVCLILGQNVTCGQKI